MCILVNERFSEQEALLVREKLKYGMITVHSEILPFTLSIR
jgi:hypothetical protein